MRVAFGVVHEEDDAVHLGQRVDRAFQAILQVGLDPAPVVRAHVERLLEVGFTGVDPLDPAQPVQRHRDGDRVEPGGQRGVAAEATQPVERADERLLRELPGQVVVARHAVAESVHAVDVGVIELALGPRVAAQDSPDQ